MNSHKILKLVTATLMLSLSSTCLAQSFSSLEEEMSARDFQQAGLNQLSPQELKFLNAWLQRHGGELHSVANPSESFMGLGSESAAPVSSHVEGVFSGWSPDSIIHLENGQAWRVIDGSSFAMPPTSRPSVTIEPGIVGSWLLSVEGYNKSARVKLVQ